MFKSCFSVSLNSSLFDRSVLRVTRALICSCSFLYYRTLKHVPLKTRQPLLTSRLLCTPGITPCILDIKIRQIGFNRLDRRSCF